jgi:hypothetical protein
MQLMKDIDEELANVSRRPPAHLEELRHDRSGSIVSNHSTSSRPEWFSQVDVMCTQGDDLKADILSLEAELVASSPEIGPSEPAERQSRLSVFGDSQASVKHSRDDPRASHLEALESSQHGSTRDDDLETLEKEASDVLREEIATASEVDGSKETAHMGFEIDSNECEHHADGSDPVANTEGDPVVTNMDGGDSTADEEPHLL